MSAKSVLFAALGVLAIVYVVALTLAIRSAASRDARRKTRVSPTFLELAIGFVTNFFDTLGIGSFAPTTSVFKLRKVVPDEKIPGTLNVGHTPPTIIQAFVFIAIVQMDIATLILMITAAVIGAWLGAGIVAGWSRRKVQIGMGLALLVAATLFLMTNLGVLPPGGNTLDLDGVHLAIGLTGNFILGVLMTLGIGLYAPCMILVSLLGMNPKAAFPVMMGSCAFLMPVASLRFIRKQGYSPGPALGLGLGGIPAVLIAAFIIKSLPLTAVRWLVLLVVVYAAIAMLRSVVQESRQLSSNPTGIPIR